MSYTQLDWLTDQRIDNDVEPTGLLIILMREDGKAIFPVAEIDALIAHINDDKHDPALCKRAAERWLKDRIDWITDKELETSASEI